MRKMSNLIETSMT